MRSGTLNVPGIVGLGKACEICGEEMAAEAKREQELRDYLKNKLETALDYTQVNGNMEHHLPGNLNMSFIYVEGESLLMGINDIAVSSGSACTSATLEPSYVLKALGLGDDVAHCSIRFGLGRFNTKAEVDYVADKIIEVVVKPPRALPPLRDGQRRHRPKQDRMGRPLSFFKEVSAMAASMVPIMLEILLLPLFVAMAIREGKRQAAERARRLEAYRASPESHLLHLK